MKLTKSQLKQIIEEELREAHQSEITSANLEGLGERVAAKWTRDGLAVMLLTPGGKPIKLRSVNDAQALIDLLEELISGPMRTMG